MNDSEIETILRQAPRPTAPTELQRRLLTDLKAARLQPALRIQLEPFWRRWVPAWSMGILLFGCVVLAAVQGSRQRQLRLENATLREETAQLLQQRQERSVLGLAHRANTEQARVQSDKEELLALRDEVRQLLQTAAALPVLVQDQKRLLAEREASLRSSAANTEVDAFGQAREQALSTQCVNNLKQIGLAARVWAADHGDVMPKDFLEMTNDMDTPKLLHCPGDAVREAVTQWDKLNASSISYQMISRGVSVADPQVVYIRCPIHGHILFVDGSVQRVGLDAQLENVDGKTKVVRKGYE